MTKWFDTNYHYTIPELDEDTEFNVDLTGLIAQAVEAKALRTAIKPVLIRPLTYLYLSAGDADKKLQYLLKLIKAYQVIFKQLTATNVEWLQIDEPILGLELSSEWVVALKTLIKL
jgi:5-methyltetrahydropteroyltriglutamate--homocysteine methyltransferase